MKYTDDIFESTIKSLLKGLKRFTNVLRLVGNILLASREEATWNVTFSHMGEKVEHLYANISKVKRIIKVSTVK